MYGLLSICYQIVIDKHHGQLDCISTPGHGAEFIIKIPLHQSSAKSSRIGYAAC